MKEEKTILECRFDTRDSFYNKAEIEKTKTGLVLYSYNTKVAEIIKNKPKVYGYYSPTTLRHIKEFLKQNGFIANTKQQILKDYGVLK